MVRKGQAEALIIVGLLVLVFVVIFFAFFYSSVFADNTPEAVKIKQEKVALKMEQFISQGAKFVLKDMEIHGGYLSDPVLVKGSSDFVTGNVPFVGQPVPFWQKCQHDFSLSRAELENIFAFALANYMKNHSAEVEYVFDRNISFDFANFGPDRIKVNILSDRIDVDVSLDTVVDGFPIREPFSSSTRTTFGRITSFARDLSKELVQNRHFDWFTIYSMYFIRDSADGHPMLPTLGVLTECGDYIYRTPDMLSDGLLTAASYVVGNTYFWRSLATGDLSDLSPRVFGIENVNGNKYEDLSANIYLTDGFSFDVRNPIMITNNDFIEVAPSMVGFLTVRECVTFYKYTYNMAYPIVINVDDRLSGNSFSFAVFVNVVEDGNNMVPGNCAADFMNYSANTGNVCSNLNCAGKVRVYNAITGKAIKGAKVTYGGCPMGTTDSNGFVSGDIPCGTDNNLSVTAGNDYEFFFRKGIPSSSLYATYNALINPMIVFDADFKKVDIDAYSKILACENPDIKKDCAPAYKCSVGDIGLSERSFVTFSGDPPSDYNEYALSNNRVDSKCIEKLNSCKTCQNSNGDNQASCQACAADCSQGLGSVSVDYMPSGTYSVHQQGYDSSSLNLLGEYIVSGYYLKPSTKNLYIMVPDIWYNKPDAWTDTEMENLKRIVQDYCRIDLVSDTVPYTTVYYSKEGTGFENTALEEIAEELANLGCLRINDVSRIDSMTGKRTYSCSDIKKEIASGSCSNDIRVICP